MEATHIRVRLVNKDTNTLYYDELEELPQNSTLGSLFRSLATEYGRCLSKMYRDHADGRTEALGWCFEKKHRYDDARQAYLCEAWCELVHVTPQRVASVALRTWGGVQCS